MDLLWRCCVSYRLKESKMSIESVWTYLPCVFAVIVRAEPLNRRCSVTRRN